MLLLLPALCEKTESFLKNIVSSFGFPKLCFEFLYATILFSEWHCFIATPDKSAFATSLTLTSPIGQRVILDAELFCSSLDSDFIGQLKRLQFEFLIVLHVIPPFLMIFYHHLVDLTTALKCYYSILLKNCFNKIRKLLKQIRIARDSFNNWKNLGDKSTLFEGVVEAIWDII